MDRPSTTSVGVAMSLPHRTTLDQPVNLSHEELDQVHGDISNATNIDHRQMSYRDFFHGLFTRVVLVAIRSS